MLQYERAQRLSPILFIVIIANSIAMALAVRGKLPFLQQFLPPLHFDHHLRSMLLFVVAKAAS